MGTANQSEQEAHDSGCNCYHCVIAFEPMAALLHRRYTSDPEIIDPWPLEGSRG